jgi:DNA polymerase III alpha subunit (gram-positive type)|tara:strand:+ start:13 stop:645 length:633 start_codon:yes stop_codon:yes gene_type:complete
MTESLLRYKKNQKYIVFDTETEGLNLRYSRPWQLSFIEAVGPKVVKSHDLFIDFEDLSPSEGAAKITNFSWNTYNKKKRDKLEVLNFFDKFLYDPNYLIVGHNVLGYDIYIHNVLRLACGKPSDYSYIDRVIDTNCLSKAYRSGMKTVDGSRILWQYKWLNFFKRGLKTNQAAMLKEFGIEFDKSRLHDGMYDVEKNFELFNKLIYNIEI